MNQKICTKCKKNLDINLFAKDSTKKDSRKSICKKCSKEERANKKRKREETKIETTNTPNLETTNTPNLETTNKTNLDNPTKENIIEEKNIINLQDVPLVTTEFDISKHWEKDKHYAAVVLAPRRSGKTTLLINYLYPYLESIGYDAILIFNKTRANEIYKSLKKKIDPNFIFENYDDRVINSLKYLQKETNNAFNFALIFDDTIGNFTYSETFSELFTIGRNFNFSIIYITQTIQFYMTTIRENTDFLFLFGFHTKERCDRAYDTLIRGQITIPVKYKKSIRLEQDYFWEFIKKNCEDYRKIVFDYLPKPISQSDNLYYLPKDISFGKKEEKEKTKEKEKEIVEKK
jgi:hypothetical protein